MALQGFESRFDDLTDYIIKITEEIWEGRGLGLIEDYYGADAPVKTPAGETRGIESVVRGTLETLKMFPDRTLLGEDVVWSEDEPGTYYSSHRIRSTMTHLGEGMFGKPTGRHVIARTIADCVCRNNQIVDEWLVRDQAAIALQLGLDPREMGRAIAEGVRASGAAPSAEALVQRWSGGPQSGEPAGQAKWLADTYRQLWSGAAINLVRERYDRAYLGYAPCDRALHSFGGVEEFLFDYLGAFPAGEFKVHHWIERNDPGMPTRIALRWTYSARHTGRGRFGEPTGAPVVVMAISQAELRNGKIYAEWHMIDEINLWSQITLAGG